MSNQQHGLGRLPPPPHGVMAYLRKVASMPTPELRQLAHRWRGEPLGKFTQDVLKHRRDVGGPVTPGASMPMMAGSPNTQNQIGLLEQMPLDRLEEYATRLGGSPMGAIAWQVLNKRRMMPNVGGAAPQPAAPQPAAPQGLAMAPQMTGGATASPTAPAAPYANGMMADGGTVRGYADGGVSMSPWWTRSEARQADNPSLYAGRPDAVRAVPPDIGAAEFQAALASGPWETPAHPTSPRESEFSRMPPPPRETRMPIYEANGGGAIKTRRARNGG